VLENIFRQLENINPSAARSLQEGLEETLTVDRLGIGAVLRRKLSTATGLLEAEKKGSTDQRLSRNSVAEGALEPFAYSAEGGADSRSRFNLIAGSITEQNTESRCNPLKLGHRQLRQALFCRVDCHHIVGFAALVGMVFDG
jgi:hypothetical protein